jgi:hypothetical protein
LIDRTSKCHPETFTGIVLFVLFRIISPTLGEILVIIMVLANIEVSFITDIFPEFIDKYSHEGIGVFTNCEFDWFDSGQTGCSIFGRVYAITGGVITGGTYDTYGLSTGGVSTGGVYAGGLNCSYANGGLNGGREDAVMPNAKKARIKHDKYQFDLRHTTSKSNLSVYKY